MDFRLLLPHWLRGISFAVPIHQVQEATVRVVVTIPCQVAAIFRASPPGFSFSVPSHPETAG